MAAATSPPLSTVESALGQVWAALPSVATQEERDEATVATREDILAFVAALHRLAHANTTEDESLLAAPRLLDTVVPHADARFDLPMFLQVASAAWGALAPAHAPLTPPLAEAIRDACVDDRPPPQLLPLGNVTTLAVAKQITVSIDEFIRLSAFAEYAPVYSTIWDSLDKTSNNLLPEDGFKRFYRQLWKYSYSNATPARTDAAAHTVFYQAIAATGAVGLTFAEFVHTARYEARVHLSADAPDGALATCVEFLKLQQGSGGLWNCDFVGPALRGRLADPEANYLPSDLDADIAMETMLNTPSCNRVLISGHARVGKSALAETLARKLNCVNIDIFTLAVQAVDAPSDPIGRTIRQHLQAAQPIPQALQVELVARCLTAPATIHRGYVLGDVPVCDSSTLENVERFLRDAQLFATPPQVVVHIESPNGSKLADHWQLSGTLRATQRQEAEAALRRKEADAEQAKRDAVEAKAERNRKRERRAERRAKIDAGELQAADEDAPDPILDEPEPEEQPELDENGVPLEPEQIAAKLAEEQAKISRRRLLFDLREAIAAGRPRIPAVAADQIPAAQLQCLQRVLHIVNENKRSVRVSCLDEPVAVAEFVVAQIRLDASVAPEEPQLQPGETDGIDQATPDGDNQLGEIKLRAMTEQGLLLSPFQTWCPVAKLEKNVLVSGSWSFSCHYRGFMYCFSSKRALRSFIDSPHIYLRQRLITSQPVLVLARLPTTLTDANVDAAALEQAVSCDLRLTKMTLAEFDGKWSAMLAEQERRNGILESRRAADAKAAAAREERRRKQREIEAKKKAASKKPAAKKGEKKADDAALEDGADAKADEAQAKETAVLDDDASKVLTTEEKISQDVEAQVKMAAQRFPPLFVTGLGGLMEDALDRMIARGVVPPHVVVLDFAKPLLPDEEPPVEEDEPEEEAPPPPANDDPDAPPAPPVKKPFDPQDPKQCRRVVTKFVDRVSTSAEDSKPAAANVTTVNCYGLSTSAVVRSIEYNVNKLAPKFALPQDGEELVVDPEEDVDENAEGEPRDPALKPGKRAIHQFGVTKKFCPVTWYKSKTLLMGDTAFWLTYRGARYLFANQNAMDEFKVDPTRFLPAVPSITASWQHVNVPPPRMWIFGVNGAGKKSVARYLEEHYRIPVFSLKHDVLRELTSVAAQGGVMPNGTTIPAQPQNEYLIRATRIIASLDKTEADEQENLKKKADTQAAQAAREAAQEAGEEVEEIDEEDEAAMAKIIEFEPEDPEAKQERVAKSMREVAAQLVFIEPYVSSGYLLVGEPATEAEATHLMDIGMVPEAVIHMKLSSGEFVARAVGPVVESRVAARNAKLAKISERKAAKTRALRELELRRWRRRNLNVEDAGGDEGEEGEEEDEEPPVPSADEIKDELAGQYDTESGNIGSVLSLFPDRRIPVCEVNADQGVETVQRFVDGQLSPNLKHRRSLYEAPMVITFDAAMELIRTGQKLISDFRYVDSVELARMRAGLPRPLAWRKDGRRIEGEPLVPPPTPPAPKQKVLRMVKTVNEDGEEVEVPEEVEPEPEEEPAEVAEEDEVEPEPELSPDEVEEMTKELEARRKKSRDATQLRACVLRNRVFFFESDANLKEFLDHPLNYWMQPPPLPDVASVASVVETDSIGLPGGHRNMGHHLAFNVGAQYLDFAKLIRWGLDLAAVPLLQVECAKAVFHGAAIADETVAELLCCRLRCVDVQRSGVVLHNIPRTATQANVLLAAGAVIHNVMMFSGTASPAVTALDHYARVSTVMSFMPHSNAALVEATRLWSDSRQRRRSLVFAQAHGFPARLFNTATPETVFTNQRSVFGEYCPYMWSQNEELVDVGDLRQFAAIHCGSVYHFSSQSLLEDFLANPEKLTGEVPPKPRPIPKVLPQKIPAAPAGAPIELCGCCPVILYDTRMQKGLRGVSEPKAVRGKEELSVQYEGKYYRLSSVAAMERFLRRPWVFVHGASLPAATKLPVDTKALSDAPPEEFIARQLYEHVARALVAAEKTRPKFPGVDAHDSCLKFIALHLKANNPHNTEHRRDVYRNHFDEYTQRATLYRSITVDAPPEGSPEASLFAERCAAWDAVQDNLQGHAKYGVLRNA